MKQLLGIVIILALVIIGFIYLTPSSNQSQGEKVSVTTSIFPYADFVKNVGGDLVFVKLLVPPGAEAHAYSPTPKEVISLQSTDLFLFNGAGLDPWAKNLIADLQKSDVKILEMTEYVSLMEMEEEDEPFDPHIWLDPVLVRKQVEAIRDALIKIDPANKAAYTDNATFYIRELAELNRSYEHNLVQCKTRDVIVSHNAFRYLGQKYNINFLPVTGLSPHAEPSAKQFGELQSLAQEKDLKFVFFEAIATPTLVETLANDLGAETLVLNPLEGLTKMQADTGETYISIMEKNLENLKRGMDCK